MFWFLKLFLTIFVANSCFSYQDYIHDLDEKNNMPYFIKREVKNVHYNDICTIFWRAQSEDPNWTNVKDEVIEHYYGKINGIHVISVYNKVLLDTQAIDLYATTETYRKYKIKFRINFGLYLKINNNYFTLSEAYKNNLIDNDTLYDIYLENCHFYKVKPIKKVD